MSDWPLHPYKGLAYYGPEDQLLFAGRESDIEVCAALLAAPNTRILLLHGRTGCGKSSFLRAGLIPTVETRGYGFEFLRRNINGDRLPVFIRSTAAPLDRLGEEIFSFASQNHPVRTATGTVEIDLSAAKLGCETVGSFISRVRSPPEMISSLGQISERLPNTLVIVLDQAEEVITLTQPADEDRTNFFRFLKLISAHYLDVKLIIALRTEFFGMFFDLMGVDASIKTDVNQFRLEELDRSGVKEAIMRPTSKEKSRRRTSPFEQYQFEYASELANVILDDLFSATQSGGMLPAMQTVCRDLYNEVRKGAKPWIIDKNLYIAGGGVTGRVDRHIAVSLYQALSSLPNLPRTLDLDLEERRWRRALYRLVKLEADGTARTDLSDKQTILEPLREAQLAYDHDKVLQYLGKPDVLVLRDFSVFNPKSGVNETKYSLGHDAVALALHSWSLQEKQAEEKRLQLAKARKRILALSAASFVFISGAAYAIWISIKSNLELSQALVSAAERNYDEYPAVAVASAIQANTQISNNFLYRFFQNFNITKEKLADMISALPSKILDAKSFGVDDATTTVRAFPSVGAFTVCCGNNKMKLIDATSLSTIFEKTLPTDNSSTEPRVISGSTQSVSSSDTFLFALSRKWEARSMMPSDWQQIVVTDGNVLKSFEGSLFVQNSKLPRQPPSQGPTTNDTFVYAWRGFVALVRGFASGRNEINVDLFVLNQDWRLEGIGGFPFSSVLTAGMSDVIGGVLSGGYRVNLEAKGGASRLNVLKLSTDKDGKFSWTEVSGFDKLKSDSRAAVCFDSSKGDYECKVTTTNSGPYFLIRTNRKSEEPVSKEERPPVAEQVTGFVTIVNAETREYADISETVLRQKTSYSTIESQSPDIAEVVVRSDKYLIRTGKYVSNVFAFSPVSLEYIGSIQSLSGAQDIGFGTDSDTVLGSSPSGYGAVWQIGPRFFERQRDFRRLSITQLIAEACKLGLRAPDADLWKKQIGFGSAPNDLCPLEDTSDKEASKSK